VKQNVSNIFYAPSMEMYL